MNLYQTDIGGNEVNRLSNEMSIDLAIGEASMDSFYFLRSEITTRTSVSQGPMTLFEANLKSQRMQKLFPFLAKALKVSYWPQGKIWLWTENQSAGLVLYLSSTPQQPQKANPISLPFEELYDLSFVSKEWILSHAKLAESDNKKINGLFLIDPSRRCHILIMKDAESIENPRMTSDLKSLFFISKRKDTEGGIYFKSLTIDSQNCEAWK